MIVPAPVQSALAAAVSDDAHVAEQRARYAARRDVLLPAVQAFGLRVEDSAAGLYLWATADEPAATTLRRLSDRGVLVAPGTFYGRPARTTCASPSRPPTPRSPLPQPGSRPERRRSQGGPVWIGPRRLG
ncbi:aminotransferase class I/II-fold pyridoxal phosphate-dependent enzyme [Janibacter melonis]|uniref:aminotransferase class I/II-fold pyridoxal phosphate-dependent enzyme n=1 Tax=Janibacter melonis TaxID=262209 RepID=UPI0027DAB376|nr:aminotransferase class I/II-fold pyridoxal phosphate-dependent enzyme [Janibacter melonis]